MKIDLVFRKRTKGVPKSYSDVNVLMGECFIVFLIE